MKISSEWIQLDLCGGIHQAEAAKIKIMLVPYDEGENSDVNYDIDSSRSSIFLDIVEN